MKRVKIKNLEGVLTNQAEFEDPTDWINQGVQGNWWGLPERTKWKDECTPEELALIKSESEVVFRPAVSAQDAKYRTQVRLLNGDIRWKDTLLEEELAQIVQEEEIEIVPAQPGQDAVYRTEAVLNATYTIEIEDITQEIKERDFQNYSKQKMQETESAIFALLSPMDNVTHLMLALFDMYIATNISGTQSEEEITNAKQKLTGYLQLMQQIQGMREARDADIEAYRVSLGL
jgi:hypothetical protein